MVFHQKMHCIYQHTPRMFKITILVHCHCISSDVLPFKCSCKVRQGAIWTSLERAILRGNSTLYRVTNVPPLVTQMFSYTNSTLCKTVPVTLSHTTKPFHDTQMCLTDISLHITLHLNSSSKHSNTFQAISTASNGENTWNFQTGEMAPQLETSWLLPCIQETAPCCRQQVSLYSVQLFLHLKRQLPHLPAIITNYHFLLDNL